MSHIKRSQASQDRPPCENFLYVFKAARWAARAAASAAFASAPAGAPATAGQTPVGWREDLGDRRAAVRTEQFPSRGGFDKGTLAAAQIGLKRACQGATRSPGKRTGCRPLSNPPLCLASMIQGAGEVRC